MKITKNGTIAMLGDLLNYTQPSKYIVRSTDYQDEYEIPVLTAGKSFVKGYTNETENVFCDLPTIIFDDFTTASRLVNFQFKVKSSAMKILTPVSDLVDIKYIFYFMQTIRVNTDTHKRYWIATFSRILIKIIPLPEQRAIVAKIERLFSELDNGISHLKSAKAKLEAYRQSVLKTAFDGKLLSSEQLKACRRETDYQPAGDLLKKINPKAMPSESKIRADWAEVRLEIACEIRNDRRSPINAKERNRRIKGKNKAELYPYYGATGQVGFIDGYLTDGEYVLVGEDGAPFYDFSRNTAYMIDGKAWVNNHAHILRSHFSNKFLLHYLNQFDFHGYVSGTTRLKLTQKSLRGIPTKIAPIPEQRAIVSAIESRFAVCDKLARSIDEALEKSQAMRQSVLKKAFDGELLSEAELRECRKQPNWEPAAKLLQRIRDNKPSKPARRKK